MSAVATFVADDVISALLTRSGGAVLAPPTHAERGGEYDGWGQFSRRDVRRLVGAGLLSSRTGWPADQLLSMFDGCRDFNPDEFVTFWFAHCLAGLDQRARQRSGVSLERSALDWSDVEAADAVERTEAAHALLAVVATHDLVPADMHAWLDRTVHEPKLLYLAGLAAWRWLDGPEPAEPGTAWSPKVRAKFAARFGRS